MAQILDLPLGSGRRFLLSIPAWGPSLSGRRCAGSSPVTTTFGVPACASIRPSSGSVDSSRSAGDLPLVVKARVDGAGTNFVGAGNLGLVHTGGVLVLLGLGVAIEVKIGHDVPLSLARSKGAAEAEDFTCQHPPDETNGVAALVVRGDGDVDVFSGGVGVDEGDDGDIDVRSLFDGLGVGPRVRDDDEAGLLERAGDVVGEVTGSKPTCDGDGTSVCGEL